MNPGEIALLLGVIPFGVLLGTTFSSPVVGTVFYLSYVYLAIRHLREGKKGLRVFTQDSLIALVLSLLAGLIVSF